MTYLRILEPLRGFSRSGTLQIPRLGWLPLPKLHYHLVYVEMKALWESVVVNQAGQAEHFL